ncbi:MAG TPA: type II toxin-antitoxin system RelE/ParE family toxin [Candidatus Paceibacterota bacterium]|nr:type II toxin-antitoxin system RelE/ParE family toxin [Candidatus Paceibacterota bacterium]
MRKEILYDKNALKELREFREEVQEEFAACIKTLKQEGQLEYPEARKVARNLFEIRVVHEGAYRAFYAYVMKESIVILHFFQKKTQKIPLKNLKLAQQRLKQYE